MNIRTIDPGQPSDVETVAAIANSVHVDIYRSAERGFLVFPMTPAQYGSRLAAGHDMKILRIEGRAVAILCGTGSDAIRSRSGTGQTYAAVYQYAVEYFENLGISDFFVLDQLAVLPECQNAGNGRYLLHKFIEERQSPVLIDVLEKPFPNPRIAWWRSNGFKRVGQVSEMLAEGRTLDGSSNVTWGIYVRMPDSVQDGGQ